jgi:hypothetical protein
LTGAFRVLPFGTQADPQGSGHGRHSIHRSESANPLRIKSVNGVFALTFTNDLDTRHLEGRKLHDSSTCNGVNIHRYECSAAVRRELLIIPEVIVVAFDRQPFLRLNWYPAITPPE